MKKPPLPLLIAAFVAVAGWYAWRDTVRTSHRGGARVRRLTGSAIQGAALDNTFGQTTPDHLLWWGPPLRPPGWQPHKLRYPTQPGQELERLIYGAPGACATVVPKELAGWLWAPPSEEDY